MSSNKKIKLSDTTTLALATLNNLEASTIARCTYTASEKYVNGGWVCISPNTYLSNPNSDIKLPLLHVFRIPIAPLKHYFNKPGEMFRFTLIFPALPPDWETFNLDEDTGTGSGFRFRNIHRCKEGVYWLFIH